MSKPQQQPNLKRDRRSFIRACVQGGAGLLASTALDPQDLKADFFPSQFNHTPSAKSVIYIYLAGGFTHIDSFDTKPERPEVQGPLNILHSDVDHMKFGEHFQHISKQAQHCAIINSMKTSQGAHQQGNYMMHTSYEQRSTIKHPSMGAWVSRTLGPNTPSLPASVLINGPSQYPGAGYWESKHTPLRVDDAKSGLAFAKFANGVKRERFQERFSQLDQFNRRFLEKFNQKEVRAYGDMANDALNLMNSRDLNAFDIHLEKQYMTEAYGQGQAGESCLLARRLIEQGVRHVEINLGGWDFHNDNFGQLNKKAPPLDQAVGALIEDLYQRGLLDSTLVVMTTEFGRTPTLNQNDKGRDHHPQAFSCLLAGGGIKGGTVYGKTDERAEKVVENVVFPPDLNATIAYALGMPIEETFYSPSGRPFQIAH
jgi:hypothetical protein